ncbi:MAG: hypothetical protein R2849_04400 [Thermomicrobiales bacterium]
MALFELSSRRLDRRSMTADMSTSLNVVSIAADCCASTSRRAIVWRRREPDPLFTVIASGR